MDSSKKNAMDMQNLSQFRGQPWSMWAKNLDQDKITNVPQTPSPDCRVTRLPRHDMGLFGICPDNDRFCAVLCQTCGAVVKPQGLQRHLEIRHTSDETALLPPPQVPAKRTKTTSVKMRREPVLIAPTPPPLPPPPTTSSLIIHSIDNNTSGYKPILPAPPKPVETSPSTILLPNVIAYVPPAELEPAPVLTNNIPRRKSRNISSADRKSAQKVRDKGYESDSKHAISKDDAKNTYHKLNNNTANFVLRKGTMSRTKDFNKLVAEHRATKEIPNLDLLANNVKSKAQSLLKTAITVGVESNDSGFSSSSSSQSSHPASQETSPVTEVLVVPPLVIQPGSPALVHPIITSTSTMATPVPTMTTTDYLTKNTGCISRTASPACINNVIASLESNVIPVYNCTTLLPQARNVVPNAMPNATATDVCGNTSSGHNSNYSSNSSSGSSSGSSPNLVHVVPVTTPQHVYAVNMPGNPVLILSKESTQPISPVPISSVNLNVNTESSSTNSIPVLNLVPQNLTPVPRPVVVSRDVIESLNVPVVMEMPTLNDNLTNITVYTTYPKPLVVSTFSAKKVGHAVVFSNRRLDFIRNQFKSVLKKGRRVSPIKNSPTVPQTPQTQTVFGVKTLNANTACRFPKQPTVSNLQATSLLAHRPNILRTPSQTAKQTQHMPKILTTGLKRPATTSPQLNSIDCKHMMLKPTASNINVSNIIGKMIVHQHEVTETGDGSAPSSHLALDKVVPVNIK